MADAKISALPAVTTPATTDEFPVNQGGTTKKETLAQIWTAPIFAAGSASAGSAPKLTSGTLMTTAEAGAVEYDGKAHYTSHSASERGVSPSVQLITLTSAYTLTSQTALQKLFNVPTNGAVTVAGNTTYMFDLAISLTAMSATSGTYSFGWLGTAVYTRVKWWALANKGAATPVAALQTMSTNTAATAVVAATTTATGQATIRGKLVIGTGGTIIPAIGLSVAAAAVVGVDSYFRIWPVGSNTVQSVGNWS